MIAESYVVLIGHVSAHTLLIIDLCGGINWTFRKYCRKCSYIVNRFANASRPGVADNRGWATIAKAWSQSGHSRKDRVT